MFKSWLVLSVLVAGGISVDMSSSTQRPDILQSKHFFSETKTERIYNVSHINQNQPLALVILPNEVDPNYENPITITLASGEKSVKCKFSSYDDLCVLDEIPRTDVMMKLHCQSKPCNVEWDLYQSQKGDFSNPQEIAEIYHISGESRHLIIQFTCNRADVQDFQDLISLHSTTAQHRLAKDNLITYGFDDAKEGYLHLKVDEKAKSCLTMKVNRVPRTFANKVIEDFVLAEKPSLYNISPLPQNDFRIDTSFSSFADAKAKDAKIKVNFTVSGEKTADREIIRTNEIQISITQGFYEFNYVIPKIDSTYENVRVELSSNHPLIVQMKLSTKEVQEVEATEESFFDLKQGEKIKYKLVEEHKAEKQDQVHLYPTDLARIKVSEETCSVKSGCEFEVEALDDVKGGIYIGDNNQGIKELIVLDFGKANKFTKKIRKGEEIYIKKLLKQKKTVQVTINTINVMVYAASKNKCKVPSQDCYEKVGNYHSPFFFETQQEEEVIFMIEGLDHSQFTLTLIPLGTEFIELKDSEPFTYLFDDKENDLKFTFKNSDKKDVTFNLIAPINTLNLFVENGEKVPGDDDENDLSSSEGFIRFESKDIKSQLFTISVRRIDEDSKNYIHFTMIASTKQTNIRLEPGITHYETLDKNSAADYVFQFNIKDDYILNFYTHNTKTEQIRVNLKVSGGNIWDPNSPAKSQNFIIDRPSDVLHLNEVSEKVCVNQGESAENCEIFIQIVNEMDMQIDISTTLMAKHSIIEIKDGLWQTFALNSVAESSYFYFYPHHEDKDINVIYKSSEINLRITYRLFLARQQDLNPAKWPFPRESFNQNNVKHAHFKPIKHFSVSQAKMSECWPNCVLLMSLLNFQHKSIEGHFSIMATNNIMEIPAKEKVDVTLTQNQEKAFLVDLKYVMDKGQDMVFYVYHSLGFSSVYMNVYSEKKRRIPLFDQADFFLKDVQTIISFKDIENILREQKMTEHSNKYLYIIFEGFVNSKISIEYDVKEKQEQLIKMLDYDTYEDVKLEAGEVKYFHLRADQEYEVKVLRKKGFPFINVDICRLPEFMECLDELKQSTEKGKQILSKTEVFSEEPCPSCTALCKVSAMQDPAEIKLHIQSKYSQIQLSEGQLVSDFTENSEQNKYTLYGIRGQDIFVNIHVTDGEIAATLTDLDHLELKKTGRDVISFVIPAQHYEDEAANSIGAGEKLNQFSARRVNSDESLETLTDGDLKQIKELSQASQSSSMNKVLISSFSLLNKFALLHLSIKSTDDQVSSSYTLSYSSGDRKVDLQDGLISDHTLSPNKQSTFYYSSSQPAHAYLTISMDSSTDLENLEITMKSCEDHEKAQFDEDCWKEFTTRKPPINKKAPSPTIMYSLPSEKQLAFTFRHSGKADASISLGINHQQVILLPLNHEFPVALHKRESLNVLIDIVNPGYLTITLRKCDESEPTFGYTFDYDGFQDQEFEYETPLNDDPKFQFYSKVKNPGTLYMHLGSPLERSLMSIKVEESVEKTIGVGMKAGNKGQISYVILDSQTAQFTISKPLCSDIACSDKMKYILMTANKMVDLYSQLVCPSSYFSSFDSISIPPITQAELMPRENPDGTLSFQFQLIEQISYVGIKAASSGDEIFYKPIQVATLWGQLARTSQTHKITITTIVVGSLLAIIICVRRNARQGYKKLSEDD